MIHLNSESRLPSFLLRSTLSFKRRTQLSRFPSHLFQQLAMADPSNSIIPAANPPPEEPKLEVQVKKSWVDEEEDEKAVEKLFQSVSINDLEFLEEPDLSNIEAVTDTAYSSASRFEDLNLSDELLKGLYVEMRFEKPSKIQAITLPMILTSPHKNLIAQAHNGSGKTTCFVLGMLSRIDRKLRVPQALCICPTRELAIQNLEVLNKMGKYTGVVAERAVAEAMENPNYVNIRQRPPITSQVVIGTPGTIKKWVDLKKLSLAHMRILVFDEADHMLAEDGFREDSLRIMKKIKESVEQSGSKCQVLLFSATFSETVEKFFTGAITDVTGAIDDYNQLFVKKEELSLESVKQYKVRCPDELAKVLVIKDKIFELGQKLGQTIIFVRTRNSAAKLHKELAEYGYEVTTIQGAATQENRDKIVKEFKDGLTQVLISTDLLARGFDQSQVNLVVNYCLPIKYDPNRGDPEPDCEVYLHRVGRAGRFGRKGAVFNLLCGEVEDRLMEKIEQHFGIQIAEVGSWRSEEDFELALKDAKLL